MKSLDLPLLPTEHFKGFKQSEDNLYVHTNLGRVLQLIIYEETFDAVEVKK